MENKKVLVSIKKLSEIEAYKKIGITNFLFSLDSFSNLSDSSFKIDELKELDINIFLNIDLIMDTNTIDKFKEIMPHLAFAKGILFEDVGVYYLLKDMDIPLMWNQSHFVTNSMSINLWLKRVHSAVLTNELTFSEIETILRNTTKPLILPIYGNNPAMYSRRYLLSSFTEYNKLPKITKGTLSVNEANEFFVEENSYGTVLYYKKPFNYLPHIANIDDSKILFYYVNTRNITPEEFKDLINGRKVLSEEKFLENKTIYKLED